VGTISPVTEAVIIVRGLRNRYGQHDAVKGIDLHPGVEPSDWLRDVGRVFPLAHLAEGLQRTYFAATADAGIDWSNVAILAVWGLAALAVAFRTFRWEPQAAGS